MVVPAYRASSRRFRPTTHPRVSPERACDSDGRRIRIGCRRVAIPAPGCVSTPAHGTGAGIPYESAYSEIWRQTEYPLILPAITRLEPRIIRRHQLILRPPSFHLPVKILIYPLNGGL